MTPGRRASSGRAAFTLIELLVVIAIITLLISITLPGLRLARESARMVVTHSDLRQIDIALQSYLMDQDDEAPPVRSGCGYRAAYELPPELATGGYLPGVTGELGVTRVDLFDTYRGRDLTAGEELFPGFRVFPDDGRYRYRAAGYSIVNEASLVPPDLSTGLFITGDFPGLLDENRGGYVKRRDESPVRYAIWSNGPWTSPGPTNPGRGPLLDRMWMKRAGQPGLITHAAINPSFPYPEIRSP